MVTKRILACDIDGTLLDHGRASSGLLALQRQLQNEPPGLRLVYATGRTFQSTSILVKLDVLPPPDAVASQVGTELWLPPWSGPLDAYEEHMAPGWDERMIRSLIVADSELIPQEPVYQTPWKISALVKPGAAQKTIGRLRERIVDEGLQAKVIYSEGRYVDVIPAHGGKRGALRYLAQHWALDETTEILACGDSGNDLDMLSDPKTAGVVVGNADDPRLSALVGHDHVYHAHRPHAAGVLEGASAFDFWAG